MHMTDAKLRSNLMFHNSFRNSQRQNNHRKCLGDRLELWPSIQVKMAYFTSKNVARTVAPSSCCRAVDMFP